MFDFAIIAIAPVPVGDSQHIEGGGLRSWEIAKTLASGNHECLLLVPQKLPEGSLRLDSKLTLMSYRQGDDLSFVNDLTRVLIIHGSHWPTSKFFTELKLSNQKPIIMVDAIVPINIEYASRYPIGASSVEIENFEIQYEQIRVASEIILSSADYVLCSGGNQTFYYQGLLSNGGQFSSSELVANRIMEFPHRISLDSGNMDCWVQPMEEPILCWFGGFYPWVTPTNLPELFEKLLIRNPSLRIKVVGAINTFIPKGDVVRNFSDKVLEQIRAIDSDDRIEIVDWLPYNEISAELTSVSAVLNLNPLVIESRLSWRTRLLNIIDLEIPILTDGHDQISESLLNIAAAIKVDSRDLDSLIRSIENAIHDKNLLGSISDQLRRNKAQYRYKYEPQIFQNLSPRVRNDSVQSTKPALGTIKTNTKLRLKFAFALIMSRKFHSLVYIAARFLSRRVIVKTPFKGEHKAQGGKRFFRSNTMILTPDISFGGANLVAFDLMDKLEEAGLDTSMIYDRYFNQNFFKMLKRTYQIQKYNSSLLSGNLRFFIINSISHPYSFWVDIENAVYQNPKLICYLYVHEDKIEDFIDVKSRNIIISLLNNHASQMLIGSPSLGTREKISEFLRIPLSRIESIFYPIELSGSIFQGINERFNNLDIFRFCLIGTSSDTRKNHRIVIEAFKNVKKMMPIQFRDFELTFLGMGADQFSRETSQIAISSLGTNYKEYPEMKQDELLKILDSQHALISISEFETLPKVVTEALVAGMIILRNSTSGVDEQLLDGGNGYLVDEVIFGDLEKKIMSLLDPEIHSPAELMKMASISKQLGDGLVKKSTSDIDNLVSTIVRYTSLEAH